jgi:5'-3' exonuclease
MEDSEREEEITESKPIVAVIDADFIPFYVCYNKKGQEEKTLDDCINICDNFINNILKATNADYYVGYLTKGKCFRYDINPDYKANRKYLDQPQYLDQIKERLLTYNFVSQKGWEADDLCMSFKAQNSQFESIIVSPDKDLLGICEKSFNPRLMQFNYHSKEEIVENFWRSMIVGDTADNIKGIPGKGPKYFNNLIDGFIYLGDSWDYIIFDEYINHFGEYEGIKEFYKNYLSLKIVDNVKLEEIKLNKVLKETFSE